MWRPVPPVRSLVRARPARRTLACLALPSFILRIASSRGCVICSRNRHQAPRHRPAPDSGSCGRPPVTVENIDCRSFSLICQRSPELLGRVPATSVPRFQACQDQILRANVRSPQTEDWICSVQKPLAHGIQRIIASPGYREELAVRSLAVFSRNHDIERQQVEFRERLQRLSTTKAKCQTTLERSFHAAFAGSP